MQAQRGSVDLYTFIHIVQRILASGRDNDPSKAEHLIGLDANEVTAQLVELFREIDLDGDGRIVWEEFTKFILDKATQIGDPPDVSKAPYPT